MVSTICDKLLPFAIAVLFSLSGVFLLLSVAINVISLIVCYCKRKKEHNDDESNYTSISLHDCIFLSYKDLQQQEVPSSVNPQYENVPAPPQSVLSMKECAAYGVVNMHSNIN